MLPPQRGRCHPQCFLPIKAPCPWADAGISRVVKPFLSTHAALWIIAGHWRRVAVKPCSLFARCRRGGLHRLARRGFKRPILAMSWLVKCVEITCDSGQRLCCGGGNHTLLSHTRLHQTKGKEGGKKKKKAQRGWHQLRTKLFNRSEVGSCNREKAVKVTRRFFVYMNCC